MAETVDLSEYPTLSEVLELLRIGLPTDADEALVLEMFYAELQRLILSERIRIGAELREMAGAEAARDPHAFGDTGHTLEVRKAIIAACSATLTMAADAIETSGDRS